jgi:hypothetical protein
MSAALSGAASAGAHSPVCTSDVTSHVAMDSVISRLPDMATNEMYAQLPKLEDDDKIGIEMQHVVQRDGEPDLSFVGTLLASAAPTNYGQERWREYRVYQTTGGTYVFSRVGRSILPNERDKFEAHTWNQRELRNLMNPSLLGEALRSALTDYFKFDALAKQLYAKLNVDTSQRID